MSETTVPPYTPSAEVREALETITHGQPIGYMALAGGIALRIHGLRDDAFVKYRNYIEILTTKPIVIDGRPDAAGSGIQIGKNGTWVTYCGISIRVTQCADKYRGLHESAITFAQPSPLFPDGIRVVRVEHMCALRMLSEVNPDGTSNPRADLECLIQQASMSVELAKEIIQDHLGPYAVDIFEGLVVKHFDKRRRRVQDLHKRLSE